MGKGSGRRPENRVAFERNWPFQPQKTHETGYGRWYLCKTCGWKWYLTEDGRITRNCAHSASWPIGHDPAL